MEKAPNILILSGPSGVGKTVAYHALQDLHPDCIEKIITTTTREKRPSEIDGKDYYFIDRASFEARIASGEMIEYALVHGNYYGSTFAELDRIIALEKYPIYIVDPQGMIHLKPVLEGKKYRVQTFFLLPPSIDELKNRLSGRGTEAPKDLEIRLANALVEMEEQDFYDHKIINETISETIEILSSLIFPEKIS